MLRLVCSTILLAGLASPGLAERFMIDRVNDNPPSSAPDNLVRNTASSENGAGNRGGGSNDCVALLRAMDHLIDLSNRSGRAGHRQIRDSGEAHVLLDGMVAVKNLCPEAWELTRTTDQNTDSILDRDAGHNSNSMLENNDI